MSRTFSTSSIQRRGQPGPRAQRVEPEVDAGGRRGALHCLGHASLLAMRRRPGRVARLSPGQSDRVGLFPAPVARTGNVGRRVGGCPRGRSQPDPRRRRRARRAARRRLLRPSTLDLTDGAGEPGRADVPVDARPSRSRCRQPGAATLHRPGRRRACTRRTLNGAALDVAGYDEEDGHRAARPGRARTSSSSTPTAATRTPARACTGSSTRSTARSTSTRSSRRPTPSGCSPASTSPTSRRRSPCT